MVGLNSVPITTGLFSTSFFMPAINPSIQSSQISVDGSIASSDYQSRKYSPELLAVSEESKINKILIRFYARLYRECIIPINEFLSLVRENDTDGLIQIYTVPYFADLISKIYAIQTDLNNQFPNSLSQNARLFRDNYIAPLYYVVDTFKHIITILKDNDRLLISHQVLQSLDSIREYVDRNFNDTDPNIITLTASAKLTVGIELMEPYRTYFERYGLESIPIDTEKLAAIQYELDQNIISNT